MAVKKEYLEGRLSAFRSMLGAVSRINETSNFMQTKFPPEFLSAIDTCIQQTEEDLVDAEDSDVSFSRSEAMEMVGAFLIKSANRKDEDATEETSTTA